MFQTFIRLIKGEGLPDFAGLAKNGAKILDVRTRREFAAGHIEGSINVPLNELQQNVREYSKDTTIILCCASGVRSASAKNVLSLLGFTHVYNGGSWPCLRSKIITK